MLLVVMPAPGSGEPASRIFEEFAGGGSFGVCLCHGIAEVPLALLHRSFVQLSIQHVRRADQPEMSEGLREVSEVLALRAELLGV